MMSLKSAVTFQSHRVAVLNSILFPIKYVEQLCSGCWFETGLVYLRLGVLGTPKSVLFSHLAGTAPANVLLSVSVQGPGISGEFTEIVEMSSCGLCDSSVLVRGVSSLRQGSSQQQSRV